MPPSASELDLPLLYYWAMKSVIMLKALVSAQRSAKGIPKPPKRTVRQSCKVSELGLGKYLIARKRGVI
jgi:hypothetical protein